MIDICDICHKKGLVDWYEDFAINDGSDFIHQVYVCKNCSGIEDLIGE